MISNELEKVLSDPSLAFTDPEEVINDTRFNREQKIRILKQWEIDARELQVATEEGMTGGEDNKLKNIREMLRILDSNDEKPSAPTKQGG